MAKKTGKGNPQEVLFKDVPEGASVEQFKSFCLMDAYFCDNQSKIDFYKLYWNLVSYSEQGNKAVNWIAKARTFHINFPHQYLPTHDASARKNGFGDSVGIKPSAGTKAFIERAELQDQLIAGRGAESFIPGHLRNNEGGN